MSHHHGSRKYWTRPRLFQLMSLLEQGKSDEQIAGVFGTSAVAINIARKRNNIVPRRKVLFSCRRAADRLGVPCSKTVRRWIEQGWLDGYCSPHLGAGASQQWVITERALLAFMENPKHWHRWKPERIPDRALREWALGLRAGVRFLTLTEAAWIACVQTRTVHEWIRRGWLPRIRNGNHVVRESDLRELLKTRAPWGQRLESERAA